MTHPIVHFDYEFSPYGQKVRLVLSAAGVPYRVCDQPLVLPRPDLERLGITYRRIPLLAIGKDVYADSSLIIDTIVSRLGKVPQTVADKAFEAWADATFQAAVGLVPSSMVNENFIKDREAIFPILARSDYASLRPSALAAFQARVREVEDKFLSSSDTPNLSGKQLSLADIHVIFAVRWALENIKVKEESGFGRDDLPKVWKLIDSLPTTKPPTLSADDAFKVITEAPFSVDALTFDTSDPIAHDIKEGKEVSVEANDTTQGKYPQIGKIVGLTKSEVVLEVGQHGVRLHFPRIGYIVRAT